MCTFNTVNHLFILASASRMLSYFIRISHDVAEAYQEAMSQTFKDFQVNFLSFYFILFLFKFN